MTTGLSVTRLSGPALLAHLDELAALRIAVFREFPYLYEGSLDYERNYLKRYAEAPGSHLVVARDGERVVGASTCSPLMGQGPEVQKALTNAGYDPTQVLYFGESVLRAEFRGQGLGHAFFDQREQVAREGGFRWVTFCAVVRPPEHPLRPANYLPHDAFWTKRGFAKRPDILAAFSWRDLGQVYETEKTMVFWLREVSP